jgi:uncharacterized membrane protein
MSWSTGFRLRQYLKGSLWVLPLVAAVLGAVLGGGEVLLDKSVHLPAFWTYTSSTASTLLSAIVGSTAALTGFVVTVTVLVVQMATGTFSARYMRLWYRDRLLKGLLAILVFTLTFSFSLLRRVSNDYVPNLGISIAGILLVVCLVVFLIYLDQVLHRLRPVAVAALVAGYVRRDFERAETALEAPDIYWGRVDGAAREPTLVVRTAQPGAIQAVDLKGLLRWARDHDVLVAMCRLPGDFVSSGAKLIEIYGGADGGPEAERKLRGMVGLGAERTIEQDPAFGIRIMVDIADLALSPAVNDPTTAVQVLDHLGDVLRLIGQTDLARSRWGAELGIRTGLVIPNRTWEDYLALGVTEIREYGGGGIQVMRRLRAMLEELREQVRPECRAAVGEELGRLDATVAQRFGSSVDLDRAGAADAQGIGGRTEPPSDRAMSR